MSTPNALVAEIEALSRTFAMSIVDAMKRASLADILGASGSPGAAAPAKRGPGRPNGVTTNEVPTKRRPGRPSKNENQTPRLDLVVAYVKSHPGSKPEAIRTALDIPQQQWGTYAARALKTGKLRKEGEKRATKYWAV